ncbi:MAG: SH3 domain-containing protein [Nitrospira sp.]|nr:SH3 domain-containing protein [Nitrospira sp.]
MNRRHPFLASLIFMAAVMTIAATAFGETLYVSAKSAQVRSGKTSLDPVVANLTLGDSLDVISRNERWLHVRTANGIQGWIYATYVSPSKPAGGDNELAALGKGFRRTDTSGVTASAGARGLDKASESYAHRAGITQQHRDAVDRMTASKIPDEEIQAFLKAGRLGEYAE